MSKVNLFIVGAAKSGTTSLWRLFAKHPAVFVTTDMYTKEPAYFSKKGEAMGLSRYEALYKEGRNHAYRLDASTAYLASPESAARIHEYNPESKILVVLRNPVERAYSLYNWMVTNGYESAKTFERALELEEDRFYHRDSNDSMPEYFWNYMYKRSGNYPEQVQRYEELFGNNVKLVSFRELVNAPASSVSNLLTWLGIEPDVEITFPRENTSVRPLDPRLSFYARKMGTSFLARMPILPKRKQKYVNRLLEATLTNRPPRQIFENTQKKLQEYYQPVFSYFEDKYGAFFLK
jgi:hypothetical protein